MYVYIVNMSHIIRDIYIKHNHHTCMYIVNMSHIIRVNKDKLILNVITLLVNCLVNWGNYDWI